MRQLLLGVLGLAAFLSGCAATATTYEVTVVYNETVTQADLDETAALLRRQDEGADCLIQASFPPVARCTLRTDREDFCPASEAELGAKGYVSRVTCEEASDAEPVDSPDQPVTAP